MLAKRWREHGDRDAAHRLVTSHLRLVTKIARDYRGYGLPASGEIVPQSRGGSRWPRTIRIRQDASVTMAEPAIAVARDQIKDRVADHPCHALEDPCPL